MVETTGRPAALCIMGPTASGKTRLAVELVRRFPFEIISVDSALVYRGMDIGTAKPDAATLRIAPHRLIDICDPAQTYSVARFRADAIAEMGTVHRSGRIPLLVGGTMLYFRALQQGLSVLPSADRKIRDRLERQRVQWGLASLHARLASVDPVAAARIHPNDGQRIQRALEVFELTGKPMTELYEQRSDQLLPFRLFKIVTAPTSRSILHRQIEHRFQSMIGQGFVQEVKRLRARGDLGLHHPSMRTVGYRQVWKLLDGSLDFDQMIQQGVAATRQLAKRQLTWLRSEPDAVWLDSLASGALERVLEYVHDAGFFTEPL